VVDAAVVDDAAALLVAVAAWARQRTDVDAAAVIGSHARALVPADRWSDIDIVLVVDDPVTYVADAGWLAVFGRPLLTFTEPTAVGGFVERRVLFDTGQDVDFALVPSAAVEQIADHPDAAAVFGRGSACSSTKSTWSGCCAAADQLRRRRCRMLRLSGT